MFWDWIVVMVTKLTELYTLERQILLYVNCINEHIYICIKMKFKTVKLYHSYFMMTYIHYVSTTLVDICQLCLRKKKQAQNMEIHD